MADSLGAVVTNMTGVAGYCEIGGMEVAKKEEGQMRNEGWREEAMELRAVNRAFQQAMAGAEQEATSLRSAVMDTKTAAVEREREMTNWTRMNFQEQEQSVNANLNANPVNAFGTVINGSSAMDFNFTSHISHLHGSLLDNISGSLDTTGQNLRVMRSGLYDLTGVVEKALTDLMTILDSVMDASDHINLRRIDIENLTGLLQTELQAMASRVMTAADFALNGRDREMWEWETKLDNREAELSEKAGMDRREEQIGGRERRLEKRDESME